MVLRSLHSLPRLLAIKGEGYVITFVVGIPLIAAIFLPRLFHYHCLDCGATGVLHRWRHHACSRVLERYHAGRPRRVRGPTPPAQFVLWLFALAAGLIVLNELGLSAR
jgi:hypothetical protein